MKKILTVSLVAMMAVSAAHADLASTAYVDTQASAAQTAAEATAAADATAKAGAAKSEAIAAAKTETESQISTFTTTHSAVLNSTIDSTKVAQIATNAENIAKNTQAITDGDNAVKAIIGEVAADKTVVQMIAEAQTAATYDDTALAGRVTVAEGEIDGLQASLAEGGATALAIADAKKAGTDAAAAAGVNAAAITTLNAGAEVVGSVANTVAEATKDMATDGELSAAKTELQTAIGLKADQTALNTLSTTVASKAEQSDLVTLQNAVNNETTGLAATYKLADEAQTAAEVTTAIDNKITGLDLANTYAAKAATETGIQEAKDAASAAQSTADSASAKATANETAISKLDETYATDTALTQGLATKQGTLTATATIGIADNGAISVNNASIGETQLSEDVNAALALADTSFQMSAVKAAAEGGDGQYALTMTVGADNSITYQWNKISYGD